MRNLLFIIITCILSVSSYAQTEQLDIKWKGEIDRIKKEEHAFRDDALGTLVLTGSSSARMYKNVGEHFPDYNVINSGFGGSKMYELQYFLDELVVKFKPDIVLIYEGDNDVAGEFTTEQIMTTTKEVVAKLKKDLPGVELYFISPKPSLARWNLADKYVALNSELEEYCKKTERVGYIDVWYPMLNDEGTPIKDIFIQDGLHMNEKGYAIWKAAIEPKVMKEK
ncbi:GDSL-type esterase/lipase family protein [Portibacter lacus]|uniref:Lipase n=1 Tax=Portibacter lacus TaxID=1099794 RepID=A0AA37SSA2_9BACT|nr:GDSL-type esterase/lipase family protein [Portibacter lacus]GLR18790.1 lipase [Portibacter lacus]